MSALLPRLRSDLDLMPSPVPDRPGLLLRDPLGYSSAVLVIPPAWVALLPCLDGEHTELDAQALLTRLAGGEIVPRKLVQELVDVLRESGFLETEEFFALRTAHHEEFRKAPVREPSHAGTAYPGTAPGIEERFGVHLPPSDGGKPLPRAIAAPHVSPDGGFPSYRAAYDVNADGDDLTFVVLGTSHYGAPDRFGVTRKPFRTPLGTVDAALELHDALVEAGGDAVVEEDFCHRAEHSIEFQVLFLQYRLRRPFRILPVLCGPFLPSLRTGRLPEETESNRRFFDALGELALRHPELVWVLGVDMAHIGRRYGGERPARAGQGAMIEVEAQDRLRLERICAGDAEGLFELVHPGGDRLNWCGFSAFYTFLRAVAPVQGLRGEVRNYEQWNIDQASVVSFAALHFHGA